MARSLTREELLGRLIALDSSPGAGTRAVADFICDYLDGPGVRIVCNPGPNDDRLNLVIARGPERADRSGLVLSGHMDTVAFDEPDWRSDPLRLKCTEGRYVGRGVCDMKGFLALAIDCFRSVEPGSLRRALVLLLTYDEELGTLGARRFVETWSASSPLPRAAVIGEPTGFQVIRMHKGHLRLRLELVGQAGHSAYPASGTNAIELAAKVVDRLVELEQRLMSEPSPEAAFAPVPYATLNVATISGGVAFNVIPGHCVIEVGIRLLPGQSGAQMTERVRGAIDLGLAGARRGGDCRLVVVGESPAMCTDAGAPIHRALCRRVGQTDSRAVAFASDAGWLRTLDLDCVLWGPGVIETAHRANESLPVSAFELGAEHLAGVVDEWCATDAEPTS